MMNNLHLKIFRYYFYYFCYLYVIPSFVLGDFGRLEIRVGKILEVICDPRYPQIALVRTDFASSSPKVILSDLYSYKIPLGHLRSKKTLFLMNLAESKHKQYNISYAPGELTNGVLLLAYDGKKADILEVSKKCVQGDIVEVEGYTYQPDRSLKLVDFEIISEDLRIDSENMATYKDKPLKIGTKESVTTKLVYDCDIIAI